MMNLWFSEQLDRKNTEQQETAAKIQELEQQIVTVSAKKNSFTPDINIQSVSVCIIGVMAFYPRATVLFVRIKILILPAMRSHYVNKLCRACGLVNKHGATEVKGSRGCCTLNI